MENSYVKFEAPESLEKEVLDFVENSYRSGKIKKGTNEVVKSIERGEAKLIVIAEDVSPPDVVFYLPTLCEERKVAYAYVKNKKDLGVKVGIASAASISITDYGKNEDAYKTIISGINDAKSGNEKKENKKLENNEEKKEKPETESEETREKFDQNKDIKRPKATKEKGEAGDKTKESKKLKKEKDAESSEEKKETEKPNKKENKSEEKAEDLEDNGE